MAAQKKLTKRAGAYKNKIGNRDSGRPVRTIQTKDLTEMLTRIKTVKNSLHKKDRTKIELELMKRGVNLAEVGVAT